jgi:hypothetical protein
MRSHIVDRFLEVGFASAPVQRRVLGYLIDHYPHHRQRVIDLYVRFRFQVAPRQVRSQRPPADWLRTLRRCLLRVAVATFYPVDKAHLGDPFRLSLLVNSANVLS